MKLEGKILIWSIILSAILFSEGIYTLHRMNGENRGPNLANEHTRTEPFHVRSDGASAAGPVNLLVLGFDKDGERSDVIMLLNYSPEHSMVNILSIARDTRVKTRGKFEKFNALYAIGGIGLVVKGVEQLTGLPINYYLTVNLKAFKEIVDLLGGVEINVPQDMDYDDPEQDLHIHIKKGVQVLDGERAEQLIRYRKGNNPDEGYIDGDIGRIKAQQEFVKALVAQKLKLEYLSKIDDIYRILVENARTNIEIKDANRYLAGLGHSCSIRCFTLPGESAYIDNVWYFICDKEATKALVRDEFFAVRE